VPRIALLQKLRAFPARRFENFVFDLLILSGLRNSVWRTPGADAGRDIEGDVLSADMSEHLSLERWYVECKRYRKSLDWPAVFEKIAYASNHNADFLLFVTTGVLTPRAKEEISRRATLKTRPVIRAWDATVLEGIVLRHPLLLRKYHLATDRVVPSATILPLAGCGRGSAGKRDGARAVYLQAHTGGCTPSRDRSGILEKDRQVAFSDQIRRVYDERAAEERAVSGIGVGSTTVLVIDDEPEWLGWVEEFFQSLRLKVEFVETLPAALEAINRGAYRLMLVDMNIPVSGAAALADSPIKQKYPGIVAAIKARSKGYGAHQVIAYTVHDDDAADAELARVNCRYVLKGRPQVLKSVIRASLGPARFPRKPKPRRAPGNARRGRRGAGGRS
jgi:CheY-like chemotaxis protein